MTDLNSGYSHLQHREKACRASAEPRSSAVWPQVTRHKNQCNSWTERSASSKLRWLLSKNTLFTCSFQIGQFSARPRCDFLFFSIFFSFCLSQYNLAGFSGAALGLCVGVRRGSCFLFWRLKPNIPAIDPYIPPPLCLKAFVYSSAKMQADRSDQKATNRTS